MGKKRQLHINKKMHDEATELLLIKNHTSTDPWQEGAVLLYGLGAIFG